MTDDLPGIGRSSEGESDPMYDEAVSVVLKTRKASISGVQRHCVSATTVPRDWLTRWRRQVSYLHRNTTATVPFWFLRIIYDTGSLINIKMPSEGFRRHFLRTFEYGSFKKFLWFQGLYLYFSATHGVGHPMLRFYKVLWIFKSMLTIAFFVLMHYRTPKSVGAISGQAFKKCTESFWNGF